MGLMQRQKGKTFERLVAARLRKRFPTYAEEIKRSIQSRGAVNEGSDVQFPGLWIECQDARDPTPRAKLAQAERDNIATNKVSFSDVIPVAVTHKLRARTIQVSMTLGHLNTFADCNLGERPWTFVTIDFDDWLDLLEMWLARRAARQLDGKPTAASSQPWVHG